MTAFVEIVFDNKDGRFPVDKDEVVLRRILGLKKDEFILDKKGVTKQDVVNLLESAGFSRSNPYYIVQQGKVTELTSMKDDKRLELLKEVAGARVYDERRTQALKLLDDSNSKKNKINETIEYINERLVELEEEKTEFKEFQQLDKERRAIEYNISDKQLSKSLLELEKNENERIEYSSNANKTYESAVKARDEVRELEKQVKIINNQITTLQNERDEFTNDRQEIIKERTNIELKVNDIQNNVNNDTSKLKNNKQQLKEIDKEMENTKKELEVLIPQFEEELKKEKSINERLQECNRKVNDLYGKQGRNSQFKTKKQRDDYLKNEIKEIEKQLKITQESKNTIEKEIKGINKVIGENKEEIESLKTQMEQRKQVIETSMREFNEIKNKRDMLMNKRKELWSREKEIEQTNVTYKDELSKNERIIQTSVNKNIMIGLQAIERIKVQYKITGVYGPIIELFEVDSEYTTAVEVAGGGNLFNVVVDTDDTAATLLNILNEEKISTRITFMPLNQLVNRPTEMPTTTTAKPIIEVIKPINQTIANALQQVFGKILLCRDLESAANYSRNYNLDCVTIDGDQVNKKGALTGGYIDSRSTRVETMKSIKKWKSEIAVVTAESQKIKKVINEIEQQITLALGEMQEGESTRNESKVLYDRIQLDVKNKQRELESYLEIIEKKQQLSNNYSDTLNNLTENKNSFTNEIGTELYSNLTEDERKQLEDFKQETEELTRNLYTCSVQRSKLESRKAELENLITNNLNKRKETLLDEIDSIQMSSHSILLSQLESDLKKSSNALNEVTNKIKTIEETIQTITKRKQTISDSLENKKNEENKNTKELQKESEKMERLLNSRSLILLKKEEAERKIREIGTIPINEVEKYKTYNIKSLMNKLHETNKKLKEYGHVNKKSIDQYMQFTDQKSNLQTKKEKLEESNEAIKELIETLDYRKDEAIERTFKGVAFHFTEVWKDLVPGGNGTLIMQKKADEGKKHEFKGVAIKVKFSDKDEYRVMNQLSGGQKSMVALALIFAIQRCDPAPFYLFDEIDAALDATFRVRVANMIKNQSRQERTEANEKRTENTQFIISTFRPELVNAAHKSYCISYSNKESRIRSIPRDEALRIIQEELVTNEGAPDVSDEPEPDTQTQSQE